MSRHADAIRTKLARGPLSVRQLIEKLNLSQPTIARAITALGNDVVQIKTNRTIRYALRDITRALPDIPVYRVTAEGVIRKLGILIPVRPEGFVMRQEDGVTLHSDGLPWWLCDMRPQGYLGRTYASRFGSHFGFPKRLSDWTDTQALRALLEHGHDVVGNLLLGDNARERFIDATETEAITVEQKPEAYARLALDAARGEMPGSSAGGEQPKFTAYAMTQDGARHVLVKFSELESGPVTERWRDLLLAEHLALVTLRSNGISAAKTQIIYYGEQCFLEVERFDRVGVAGRRALHSLTALDAEFVGHGTSDWPTIATKLATGGKIEPEAIPLVHVLWAFGTLIGNTDMHNGNLSFIAEHGCPYSIAPAYDMTPMAFRPTSGGALSDTVPNARISASVRNEIWKQAEVLARDYLARIETANGFSKRFQHCITAMKQHIESASVKIARLE